jgi:hypothetical protein
MEKHATTASRPNVAVTGICSSARYGATRASHPLTGRCETIMNSPPMIVSGTTATIPALIAERYVFSPSAVSARTMGPFGGGA